MTRATDIEQRASEWVIRSESGNFTQEMRAELERWLQADPRNRGTFVRIREAWRRAGRFTGTRPLDGDADPDLLKDTDPTSKPGSNTKLNWPRRVAVAAILTLVLCLIGLLVWSELGPHKWIRYTTSIGGYQNVPLPDGTNLQLNTDTELKARLSADQRVIELIRGEALINVAHDPQRAFTLRAEDTSVHADLPGTAGATFAVRLRAPERLDVSVTSGSVALAPAERIIDVPLGRTPENQSMLDAGELAIVRPGGIHRVHVGLRELNRKLSWTAGLLSFQGETLAEVTDEFNRYNHRQLVVVDPSIAGRRIGGAFQATDLDSFLSALQRLFDVRADEQRPADSDGPVIRLSRAN